MFVNLVRGVIVSILVIFGASPPSDAQQAFDAPSAYSVQFKLANSTGLLGTPRATVLAGEEAFIAVPKAGGYALRFVVNEGSAARGADAPMALSAEVYYPENGAWRKVAAPRFQARLGEAASITVPVNALGGASTLVFEARVSPGTLSRASAAAAMDNCALYKAVVDGPLHGAKNASLIKVQDENTLPGDSPPDTCCDTGCLRCCGKQVCCEDKANCPHGCCTF